MQIILSKIKASNFKNFSTINASFSKGFNCFFGKNGSGKTNMLDLVYFLSISKSNFNISDNQLIKHQTDFYRIESDFLINQNANKIIFTNATNKKRKITNNEILVEKMADYIGLIPVIFIAPDDISLVKAYSNDRRKWINQINSQIDKNYLKSLITYNKALEKRNNYLKNNSLLEQEIIDYYDKILVENGSVVYKIRKAFLKEIEKPFLEMHQKISGSAEEVAFVYNCELNENNFEDLLKQSLNADRILKRTSKGIHKDDINFVINKSYNIKKLGSEGQQKSFLLALKLAAAKYLFEQTGKKPILLLDDIFDKLDSKRVEALINTLNDEIFGQVFITDTELERLQPILNNFTVDKKIFKVNKGVLTEV